METIPNDVLLRVLTCVRASTLIRLTMTCRWMQEAATRVARDKVFGATQYEELDGEAYRPWEWTAVQPLAMLFRAELRAMLSSLHDEEMETDPGFVVFRVTEDDLDRAVDRVGEALLVYNGDCVDWLHEEEDYDEYGGGDVLEFFGLEPIETKWQVTGGCDYLAFTQHLPLHPRYGRPTIDAGKLATVTKRAFRAWFDETYEDERRDEYMDDAQCTDVAVLLTRFTWGPYMQDLYYKRCPGRRLRESEVSSLLDTLPVPAGQQQRPSPFDALTHRDFFHATFESTEKVYDPFGGPPSQVLVHRAAGYFRCTLSFFDAVAK